MPATSTLLLVLLAAVGAESGKPAVTASEFREWFDAASHGALRVPSSVADSAATFRYVFVGGFANERMRGYFADNARTLHALGVPQGAIHYIFPSSHRSFDENCDGVADRFRAIAAAGDEPLIIIGHSRGAGDALAFALRHPDFVRKHVYALFLVQGAFGGTGAADYVMGEGSRMDRQMPLRLRALAGAAGRAERFVLKRGKHDGLNDLTREECSEFWERMRRECSDAIPVVAPRTFFVTTQADPSRFRLFRRAVATYLDTYYGPNDGLILLEDQSLPGLGTRLEVSDAGHTELTHRAPARRDSRGLRTALVESIVMAVGRPDDGEGAAEDETSRSASRLDRRRDPGDGSRPPSRVGLRRGARH